MIRANELLTASMTSPVVLACKTSVYLAEKKEIQVVTPVIGGWIAYLYDNGLRLDIMPFENLVNFKPIKSTKREASNETNLYRI